MKLKNYFRLFLGNFLISVIYFVIAYQSLKLATINSNVSPVWPPAGFAILVLCFKGFRFLPSIFFGALIANYMIPSSIFNSTLIACGNSLEASVGFLLLNYFLKQKLQFEELTDCVAILICAFLAPILGSFIGVFTLVQAGVIQSDLFFQAWLTWWIGDAIGILLLLPIGLAWLAKANRINLKNLLQRSRAWAQRTVLLVGVLALFYYVVSLPDGLKYVFFTLSFLTFFVRIKDPLFLAISNLAIASMAIGMTIQGIGPFSLASLNENLLNLEIFLVALSASFLVLSGLQKLNITFKLELVMFAGWVLWGAVFFSLQKREEDVAAIKQSSAAVEIQRQIERRLADYINVLIAGRSLFAIKDIRPGEWRDFVASLNLLDRAEGINGIGVVKPVAFERIVQHEREFQKHYPIPFTYKRVPGSPVAKPEKEAFVISYVEPLAPNLAALGLDLATEPRRKEAAERARLTGLPSLSKPIQLIQDSISRASFLLFIPVFKRGLPVSTENERKVAFMHWIYSPFIAQNFFEEIVNSKSSNFAFKIFEGESVDSEKEIYRSSKLGELDGRKRTFKSIELAGQKLTVELMKKSDAAVESSILATWVGFFGAISVLFVIILATNLQGIRERAKELALSYQKDFVNSQEKLKIQEAKIIESSKLATLGEMAGGIAHEINNPLAIILGKSKKIQKLCENGFREDSEAKILHEVDKIASTVARISKIIKGLRQFARDASSDPLSPTSVSSIVEDSIALCQERFNFSNVELRTKIEFSGLMDCRATEVSQVLLNLINNSFDAVVDLDSKWVEIRVFLELENVVFWITDSGPGISKEIEEKIFAPFFTTKEVGKGTGLGLSISKGIVETHQGKFFLDRQSPNTRFVLKIPLKTSLEKEKEVA